MNYVTYDEQFAQGDLLLEVIDALPDTAIESLPQGQEHIVGHSETGHHHVVNKAQARFYEDSKNPLICYLQIDGDYADLVHLRSWDIHKTVRNPHGIIKITREREETPEGWRRVED